jgi:cation-transporting ATPase E
MGLINVIGIGMPSFLLTLERHEDWKAEGFVVHVLKTCLPAALTMVISILLVQVMNRVFGWSEEIYSYFNLMLGALVAILVVAQVCWPLNRFRRLVLLASIVVFFAAILLLPGFYDIHSLWTPWSFLLLPLAVLISVTIYFVSRKTNKLVEDYQKGKGLRGPGSGARL